jgi:hypothetical protein
MRKKKRQAAALDRETIADIERRLRIGNGSWSFAEIAAQVGCGRALVAKVNFRMLEIAAEAGLKFY